MGIARKINYYFLSQIAPKSAIKLSYFEKFKEKLDFNNVNTLNQKINWLKLYRYKDNELVSDCADKYKVREYIKTVDSNILVNLLGVWDSPNDIKWDELPQKFVLKLNHGAGYNIVCQNKDTLDIEKTKKQLSKWMKEDFWKVAVELQYKDIERKIIAEEFIETETGELPNDYKIYCFHGKPMYIMSCEERERKNTKFYYFNTTLSLSLSVSHE